VAFAFSLLIFAEFQSHERMEPWLAVLLVLQVAAAVAVAIGLAKRRESGWWLFWPVWLWNFVMICELVRLRFFFLRGWNFG
jgi:hypothetical protein